jgi:flavin-dependent dehydrogenase
VALRHGVAAQTLDFEAGAIPRVTGVDGIAGDLVLDARGPRSSSDEWLAAIGARPVAEQLHESGIVYFSRFYRTLPGADVPPFVGPTAADIGYLKYAIFVGDNDTFSITFAVESDDETLRKAIVHPENFEIVARSLLGVAPWRAPGIAEPITDVHIMAGLRNRYRPLVDADGTPLVHGFLTVGDASVCTNPLYGRGCSLAFVHAFGLADALREHPGDLDAIARNFAQFTERELVPWFKSAVMQDAQARAMHEELSSEDPRAFMQKVFRDGLLPALRTSPLVFRAFLRWFNLLATPEALISDPAVVADVMAAFNNPEPHERPEPLGPERAELLERL